MYVCMHVCMFVNMYVLNLFGIDVIYRPDITILFVKENGLKDVTSTTRLLIDIVHNILIFRLVELGLIVRQVEGHL